MNLLFHCLISALLICSLCLGAAVSFAATPGNPGQSARVYAAPSVAGPLLTDTGKHTGFVQHWLALGALPFPGGRKGWQDPLTPEMLQREVNFDKDLLVSGGGEADIQPWPGNSVSNEGTTYTWQRATAGADGHVDLGALYRTVSGAPEHALAYLACTCVAMRSKRVMHSRSGSDDGFKLWVNGEYINGRHLARGCGFDDDMMLVRFHAGVNLILFKVTQETGGWAGALRLLDTGYRPISGITERSCAPDEKAQPGRVPPHPPTPPLPRSQAAHVSLWTKAAVAPIITRVRLYPAPGFADKIAGAHIVGSNSGQTIGFVDLAKIEKNPAEEQMAGG